MKAETALRHIRQKIFDYPEHKQAQADRVLAYLKTRYLRSNEHQSHVMRMQERHDERMLRLWA